MSETFSPEQRDAPVDHRLELVNAAVDLNHPLTAIPPYPMGQNEFHNSFVGKRESPEAAKAAYKEMIESWREDAKIPATKQAIEKLEHLRKLFPGLYFRDPSMNSSAIKPHDIFVEILGIGDGQTIEVKQLTSRGTYGVLVTIAISSVVDHEIVRAAFKAKTPE